jgi:hypothetical protein
MQCKCQYKDLIGFHKFREAGALYKESEPEAIKN